MITARMGRYRANIRGGMCPATCRPPGIGGNGGGGIAPGRPDSYELVVSKFDQPHEYNVPGNPNGGGGME